MKQETTHKELAQDQAQVESLFSKEALTAFDLSLQSTPADYFDTFPTTTLQKIKQGSSKKIFRLSTFSKIAIAASVLTIAITTALWYPKNIHTQTETAAVQMEEISNEELETYVSTNEVIAEVDWQAEMNKTNAEFMEPAAFIIDDSNKTKN
jgi:magnesium-transporting ATPase (P-type)